MIRYFSYAILIAVIGTALARGSDPLLVAPDGTFTVAVIPDTQRYLGPGTGRDEKAGPVHNPAFASRTAWLADNVEAQRIVFVSHMGDIVDRNVDEQWRVARQHMDRLHATVPYGISVGNHDMIGATGDSSLFQTYFGAERFVDMPWYGGNYGGRPDHAPAVSGNNANSYQLLSAAGLELVFLHLECNAPDDVLAWADTILEAHRNRMAIITTHMYLGGIMRKGADEPQGRMHWKKVHGERGNTPQDLWEKCFSKHPNVFLVLCGDQSASISHYQVSTGLKGNRVHEILTDYPRDADDSDWIRLLRFYPERGVVEVITYSPAQDRLCDGRGHLTEWNDHQFELDIAESVAAHRALNANPLPDGAFP